MNITSIKTKVNGEWKPALIDHTKVDGVWKDVVAVWTKIAGEWVSDLRDVTFNVTAPLTAADGVYIQDIKGNLYTKAQWNTEWNDTAVGVAIISANASFVIYPTSLPNGIWGESSLFSGVTVASNAEAAKSDYNGYKSTNNLAKADKTSAAYSCTNVTFKNGQKGYLGSVGEWMLVSANASAVNSCLTLIGGTKINTSYSNWTSTQWYDRVAYYVRLVDSNGANVNTAAKTSELVIRPFTTLQDKSHVTDVNVTMGNTTVTSDSPITVPARVGHTYEYTISKDGHAPITNTITVDDNVTIEVELNSQ